jgi:hypothetical protein
VIGITRPINCLRRHETLCHQLLQSRQFACSQLLVGRRALYPEVGCPGQRACRVQPRLRFLRWRASSASGRSNATRCLFAHTVAVV